MTAVHQVLIIYICQHFVFLISHNFSHIVRMQYSVYYTWSSMILSVLEKWHISLLLPAAFHRFPPGSVCWYNGDCLPQPQTGQWLQGNSNLVSFFFFVCLELIFSCWLWPWFRFGILNWQCSTAWHLLWVLYKFSIDFFRSCHLLDIFQAKIPSFFWFQLLKSESFPGAFLVCAVQWTEFGFGMLFR